MQLNAADQARYMPAHGCNPEATDDMERITKRIAHLGPFASQFRESSQD
jgi:hypothetical protein